MKNRLLQILLVGILFAGASCSKDETPGDPTGTVTLNMMDESNGKTIMAGIYINKANNFFANYGTMIADLGTKKGIGVSVAPKLDNLASQVAVSTGHLYQIFESGTIERFPSNALAISVNSSYYRMYVVSPFKVENKVTGAVVKHVKIFPDGRGLPAYGQVLGVARGIAERIEFKLPKDAECAWDADTDRAFSIEISKGVLIMRLNYTPNGDADDEFPLQIRLGSVYTTVIAKVESY